MYFDLCLETQDVQASLREQMLVAAYKDGFTGIAWNINFTGSLAKEKIAAPVLLDLKGALEKVGIIPEPARLSNFLQLTRLTVTIEDSGALAQLKEPSDLINSFDIVAVKTKNEKVVANMCMESTVVDLVTFDMGERLPKIKPNIMAEGAGKGLLFELQWGEALRNEKNRRMVLSNLATMTRISRGKFLVLSSSARSPLHLRSPTDLYSLGHFLGLTADLMFQSLSTNPSNVIKRSRIRLMAKGTVKKLDEEEREVLSKVYQKVKMSGGVREA